MPEGPEIRLAADKIAAVVENNVIEEIEVGLPHLEPFVDQLIGKKVTKVETRGKALLTHFENGLSIYSHNQLYGVWKTVKRGEYPTTNRALRLALHTRRNSAILYSASDISVWQHEALCTHPLLSKLGPDILSSDLTEDQIIARLTSKRFANRALSSLYLDQHFLAGIGNYLRTEILFAANVHPDLKPKQLSPAQLKKLAKMTLQISVQSYETRGYTVAEEFLKSIDIGANNIDVNKYEASRFMAFDRESQPCRICVTPIERLERNTRRVYVCPHCQPNLSDG